MAKFQQYFPNIDKTKRYVNQWDILALILVFGVLFALAWGGQQMSSPYQIGENLPIQLDPSYLPGYGIRTILRMIIAMFFSLLFTLTVGTLAAKSERAERLIIPMIDVLQSIPVLTFLSISVLGFIRLFPGSLLGPECAAIFVIFTAQVWNMTLGFYQSVRTVPKELHEAADMFRLSPWQRFWRLEVPFSMSSLLWNTMISMSASWFFVVASEAITVANTDIRLPGIGSYIAVAIDKADVNSVFYAIFAMLIIIVLFDQLIFRPLLHWAEKFNIDETPREQHTHSWIVMLVHRTKLLRLGGEIFDRFVDAFVTFFILPTPREFTDKPPSPWLQKTYAVLWQLTWISLSIIALVLLLQYISATVRTEEIIHVFWLGLATGLRVLVLIFLSALVWVPVGVWIGLRPHVAYRVQPVIQFAAAFPAYLLFPVVVMTIVKWHLNPEIWTAPLMILGSQWYILFNVIAGTLTLPQDLYYAADNFGVRGWLWWKRVALPGVLPFFVTGAITAAGGAWNASIVAEWVHWGDTVITATGLGAYITQNTNSGDLQRVALGTGMMSLLVIICNRILWRPLYRFAERRCSL